MLSIGRIPVYQRGLSPKLPYSGRKLRLSFSLANDTNEDIPIVKKSIIRTNYRNNKFKFSLRECSVLCHCQSYCQKMEEINEFLGDEPELEGVYCFTSSYYVKYFQPCGTCYFSVIIPIPIFLMMYDQFYRQR